MQEQTEQEGSNVLELGKVIFVGAGPGAEDLLTMRAVRALMTADVVLHDALGTEAALSWCSHARCIAVGKRAGGISTEQAFINRRLVSEAKAGLTVIRLKGGDPVVFGRLDEELNALREAGIAYEIVPGITAASAAAAAAGVSLTRRGIARSVTITTPAVQRGAHRNEAWLQNCDPSGTSAVYMAGGDLPAAASALLARGYDGSTPTVVARSVSLPEQQIERWTLAQLAGDPRPATQAAFADQGGHTGPCLLMVGPALAQSPDGLSLIPSNHPDASFALATTAFCSSAHPA